jgi:hypothetical protein
MRPTSPSHESDRPGVRVGHVDLRAVDADRAIALSTDGPGLDALINQATNGG